VTAGVKCAWFGGLDEGHRVYAFIGKPGVGKTTAALHLVAYDLWRRGLASSYAEALRGAVKRLYMGLSVEDLFMFIRGRIEAPADWIILDDAAVTFHDFADPYVWADFIEIIRLSRDVVATRGVIFTTPSLRFLSRRLRLLASVYRVERARLPYTTALAHGGCSLVKTPQPQEAVAVFEVSREPEELHHIRWTVEPRRERRRLAGLIPLSPELAMPPEVEEMHIKIRKRRVYMDAEEATKRLKKKKKVRQ
jgi:RecA/RadA recombinase